MPRGYVPGMDGMDWMAGAMRAAQTQLLAATHNLANVGSDGFRRIRAAVELSDRGLRVRESVDPAQGGIRETGRPLDLALIGAGAFRTSAGPTRNGSFVRDRDGYLADRQGHRVSGVTGSRGEGPLPISLTATIGSDGSITDAGRVTGRIPLPPGTTVRSGALESSSVDAISETLAVLTAQRAFETAQKTLVAIDQTRDKAVNDVVRLK